MIIFILIKKHTSQADKLNESFLRGSQLKRFAVIDKKGVTFILRGLGKKFFQSKQKKFGIRNTS